MDPERAARIAERFQLTLALFDFSERAFRQKLRRKHPAASEIEIDAMVGEWLERRPGAELGVGRLSTVRLSTPGASSRGVVVDLLFASSGIEPEIIAQAEAIEIVPGLTVPIARIGHLLALKLLARDDRHRPQDWNDIRAPRGCVTSGGHVSTIIIHEKLARVFDSLQIRYLVGGSSAT